MLDLDELEAKAKAAGTTWVKDGAWAEICVQTAEVLDLIRELREARARIAMVLEWFGRESSIIYELSESIRVDIAQAAAAEREACAALCDRIAFSHIGGERCAALIRARGAKGCEKC